MEGVAVWDIAERCLAKLLDGTIPLGFAVSVLATDGRVVL